MAFLLRNNAVYLHIPKTGGTWVRTVFKHLDVVKAQLGAGHSTYDRTYWNHVLHHDLKVIRYIFRRAIRSPRAPQKMTPGCFTFCFVREPLKWYESWWRFRQMNKWAPLGDEPDFHRWYPTSTLNGLGSPDFNVFMHNVNKKRPGFVTEMYSWYVRPGVTFVGKQENLKRDLYEAFSLMNMPIEMSRIEEVQPQNETDKTIAAPEWDPVLRKQTLRFEYTGYVRYGYPLPVPFD